MSFVSREGDPMGTLAIEILQKKGFQTKLLQSSECAKPGDIAFFTSQNTEAFGRKRRILRATPHKFGDKNIKVPDWAAQTPFLLAIRPDTIAKRPYERLVDAVKQAAETYSRWNPWTDPVAPWSPHWHLGSPPEGFTLWRKQAQELISPPSFETGSAKYLKPVFKASKVSEKPTLIVIGCAAFNKPHTDVVDQLLPQKMTAVVSTLSSLISNCAFEKVSVVVPEGNMLEHELIREHLHPFMFMSVADVEQMLGKPFVDKPRLWDRVHKRDPKEIAEALDTSALAMKRQLVEPLAHAVKTPVEPVSWTTMVQPYLNEASKLVNENKQLLEAIYLKRVETRPSYAALHSIDPIGGLKRTSANAVLYAAEAMYLRDNPECVVANFEANDVYWLGLAPMLRPIWGERIPYIGMANEAYRQPWGY